MGDELDRMLLDLQGFADKLKSGEPIHATRVERFDTPDGPMHVRTPVVLGEEGERDA